MRDRKGIQDRKKSGRKSGDSKTGGPGGGFNSPRKNIHNLQPMPFDYEFSAVRSPSSAVPT
eukprot:2739366-Amphidinium_carterae.1